MNLWMLIGVVDFLLDAVMTRRATQRAKADKARVNECLNRAQWETRNGNPDAAKYWLYETTRLSSEEEKAWRDAISKFTQA